ncbi:MAG: CopD family protein [Rubrivivax sp.]|nr:CopD family protein [Rubrivivax sp.]
MLYATLKTLHLLAVVLWVGGMVFVLLFLRPALDQLAPPERLKLMREVLRRFFTAVAVALVVLVGSGLWMVGRTARALAGSGAAFTWPPDWVAMTVLGIGMALIFVFIRTVPYRRFVQALAGADLPAAAAALGVIRRWVAVNAVLGVVVIAVAALF